MIEIQHLDELNAFGIWDTEVNKWVIMGSGKSVWVKEGSAKNALLNDLRSKKYQMRFRDITFDAIYDIRSFTDQKRFIIKRLWEKE